MSLVRRRSYRQCLVLALSMVSGSLGLAGQSSAPTGVLAAAAKYVAAYEEQASSVVLDEHYVQTVTPPRRGSGLLPSSPAVQVRKLRSEVVVLNSDRGWIGFRDVVEVDGAKVPDRSGRLERLFAQPLSDTVLAQALSIANESARFNLGRVSRTLNYPTMALMFLRAENQDRSLFTERGSDRVGGVQTLVIGFQESRHPTLIGAGKADVVASGRFWIEAESGRIRRSELIVREKQAIGTYRVEYGPWPALKILAPVSLAESISLPGAADESISGQAEYSNVRRFNVEVVTGVTERPESR